MTKKKPASEHKPRGRPGTRVMKLNATPEEAARAFFSHVKPAAQRDAASEAMRRALEEDMDRREGVYRRLAR